MAVFIVVRVLRHTSFRLRDLGCLPLDQTSRFRISRLAPVELARTQRLPCPKFRCLSPGVDGTSNQRRTSKPTLTGRLSIVSTLANVRDTAVFDAVAAVGAGCGVHDGQSFTFDKVFPPQASQAEVYEVARPLVLSAIDG